MTAAKRRIEERIVQIGVGEHTPHTLAQSYVDNFDTIKKIDSALAFIEEVLTDSASFYDERLWQSA